MVILYINSSKGLLMKNYQALGLLLLVLLAAQVAWYLTSKGVL